MTSTFLMLVVTGCDGYDPMNNTTGADGNTVGDVDQDDDNSGNESFPD